MREWIVQFVYTEDEELIRSLYGDSELIRCKDCRWGRKACGNIECNADKNVPPEYHPYDWFCPNGEREDG